LKGYFWADLRGSDNSQDKTDQVKKNSKSFVLANFGFLKQIFRTNVQKKLKTEKMYLVSANVKFAAFIKQIPR
jgi:hypothetical protein